MRLRAASRRSLRRTFKGEIEAVRDIDLAVAGGEVFAALGAILTALSLRAIATYDR